MPNHFALLELPARPWLDPEVLKGTFHRLGAARHPDAAGGDADAFAAVNSAWQTLRDPALRLRHLLDLEGAPAPSGSTPIPQGLADIFMSLAALRRSLDAFLPRQSAASGALAKALLAGERNALDRELRAALAQLDESTAQTLDEVRALDAAWSQRNTATLARVATLQQSLAFVGKWSDQLREALFQLSTEH